MKNNWTTLALLVGGIASAALGQQYSQRYPQQYSQQPPPYQGDPNYGGQYNGQYDDGQYSGDRDNGQYSEDAGYPGDTGYDPSYDQQSVNAPPPPPPPSYAYDQPPIPAPGYSWIDGYWNWLGGRYTWVGGYWALPPIRGGYWLRPHYSGGRYFVGHWGGGSRGYSRGYGARGDRVASPRSTYVAPRSYGTSRQNYVARGQSSATFARGGGSRQRSSEHRGRR